MSIQFERIQRVKLPFDRRHSDPKKNYGIHGLDIWFILKGSKGATQFMFTVDAQLPHVNVGPMRGDAGLFSGYDVGYHSLTPQYEGQSSMGPCDLFPGHECYYDGSGLQAADWVKEIFSIKGERLEEHVWRKLEEEYKYRFGDIEVVK